VQPVHADNQRILEKLTDSGFVDFCGENSICLAILFGSRVTGRARDTSDFDLAVLIDTDDTRDILTRGKRKRDLIHNLSAYFCSSRFDLVVLNDASSYLIYQVTQTGKVLFEKTPGVYAQLASLAIRQYTDGQLFREAEKIYLSRQV
jgi:predicted nucleotidyltransferase